ncbi:hypothetical protein ILUMI_22581, partial [Ignelater luminosus]
KGVKCSSWASALPKDLFTLQKHGVMLTLPPSTLLLYYGPLPLKRPKYLHVKELATKYVPSDCMWFYDRLKCQGEEEPMINKRMTDRRTYLKVSNYVALIELSCIIKVLLYKIPESHQESVFIEKMFFVRMANNWKECTRRPLSHRELEEIVMEILSLQDNVEVSEFEDSDIKKEEIAMNLPIEVEETDEMDEIKPQEETDKADRKWRKNVFEAIENYQLDYQSAVQLPQMCS